ncbi:MAG: hypothetical protein QF441_00505 [Bacteriovoracaceae bacterium]|jgi:hypothetical protein|nr:hypothetical protein [Halobacteriovoraceae bacterium]MDP7319049.1 hypothetical protein [Bacteriovoracaceae bacterium]
MEKGFNDDELADIMNEIESLEKEFTEDVSQDVDTVEDKSPETSMEVSENEAKADGPKAEVEEDNAVTHYEEVVAESQEHEQSSEQEFHHQPESNSEPTVEVDQEMSEVLDELSEMPAEEVVAKHKPVEDDANVHHLHTASSNSHFDHSVQGSSPKTHSSMSFKVEGDMKLDLSFQVSGKEIHLNISEEVFEIELEGGMKFSLPVHSQNSNKKAA